LSLLSRECGGINSEPTVVGEASAVTPSVFRLPVLLALVRLVRAGWLGDCDCDCDCDCRLEEG
jgi:hypothetical protein